jgi:hypothetical protein
MNRRRFLALAGALPALGQELPPVRRITPRTKFHWFGYYDKLQFDPTSRYLLGMEVGFEHRSPTPTDKIRIGMVDLKDKDRWTDLGESGAWCWQQGCMLQWLPGSRDEVIYNDREKDTLVSRILNIRTGKRRTLPGPIYCVSPDARWALACDFPRLNHQRPGYGYAFPDPYRDIPAPKESGIWRMDLTTGKRDLIITLAQAATVPYKLGEWGEGSIHRFNHLLYSPSGKRFIFLHRRNGGSNPKAGRTRMFTARPDGTDLYVLDPYGDTSHFIWRRDTHVMAWANHPSHGSKFYLYEDKTGNVEVMAPDQMPVNGHNTYLPGWRWILNDTYPDKDRLQHPYLYDTATNTRHPLGHFLSPKEYTGEWRCDTHPRFSPDGKLVCIDSPHEGGRQMFLIDIRGIVGS